MDVVVLPKVWPEYTIAGALQTLKDYRRAGVVRHDPNDTYRLLFAGDLLYARAGHKETVGQIEGGTPIVIIEPSMVTTFNVDLVRPVRTERQYEKLLDTQGTDYGLIGETASEVMIVTRHEPQGATLSTTGGYECTGTPQHYFPEPGVSIGQDCPLYPRCKRTDRTVPKIQPA